ncbi:hypothetical protein DUNSADRAFT_9924 [Dunaliella salina]|uniref:Uncharacterized protein n=1 Tax=Dunaliella salina TaxID=3046 RepID=A0ABQ7GGF1_DUNSA|nr:hypothetical protein DUNSADRAFT_9924 [Dunaliella salina]|eukprot:KAF5833691.1 hypothetical protein DUNSADRAFT_9924 [Dunaliella salina]
MALLNKLNLMQGMVAKPGMLARPSLPKRSPVCKAQAGDSKPQEAKPQEAEPTTSPPPPAEEKSDEKPPASPASSVSAPEGFEWAKPIIAFLESEDVKPSDLTDKVTSSDLYQQYGKEFFEGPVGSKSAGWNKIPETINGRAAMIGFLTAALGEIFGGYSFLEQFADHPQSVLVTIALLTVATIVPVAKGTEGNYLRSLYDTYALPEDLFTEKRELLHGRLAMLGLISLITIELFKGTALL